MSYVLIIAMVLFAGNVYICDTISIHCTYDVGNFYSIGSIYYCDGILVTGGSAENVTSVTGSHQSGKSNADVLGLTMPSQNMQYFPRNFEAFLPNLIAFYMPLNSISSIKHDHLAPFSNLQYLDLRQNSFTSIDSNLFTGFKMTNINFYNNIIVNFGHDFYIPDTAFLDFRLNTCINKSANNANERNDLRISLTENCPPSTKQIAQSLTIINGQVNSLQQNQTIVNGQVQSLVNKMNTMEQNLSEMDSKIKNVTNTVTNLEDKNLQLTNAVTALQQSNVELTDKVAELTDEVTDLQHTNSQLITDVTSLQQNNAELTDGVGVLTGEVTSLQQNNEELTNRNLHLETRIAFLDTRAGYLEVRVAMLESIIENRLGLKISENISENEN